MGGPVPKRSSERRRRNKDGGEITKLSITNPIADMPKADPTWPQIVINWYNSLGESAQAFYYEPSDWAHAYIVAEALGKEFTDLMEKEKPLRAMMLQTLFSEMNNLLTTEGARRRLRLEIERQKYEDKKEIGEVTSIMAKYSKEMKSS